MATPKGLFVGLSTIDVQYLIERFPASNSKQNARQFSLQPGGPAYSAAVAFAFLGGDATVVSAIGTGSLAALLRHDAEQQGLTLLDAAPGSDSLPVSSIFVEADSGNRTIVYNSHGVERFAPVSPTGRFDVILVDGFYPELALPILERLAPTTTVVTDGDIWQDETERILRYVDIAICAEDFAPPGRGSHETVVEAIRTLGPTKLAFTRGARPILWFDRETSGDLSAPSVPVVDTLGAGDIFHGAFCFHHAAGGGFTEALEAAAEVASTACTAFGPRAWMATPDGQQLQRRAARSVSDS